MIPEGSGREGKLRIGLQARGSDRSKKKLLKETTKWKIQVHMPRGEHHERVLVGYDMVGSSGRGWFDETMGRLGLEHDVGSG